MLDCALIGCGRVAPNHLFGFAANPELSRVLWLCDREIGRAEELAHKHGITKVTRQAVDVLSDRSVRIVSIATDHDQHYRLAKSALLAGKHVLVEKPLALARHHAQDLISLAKSRGLVLGCIAQHRFDPALRAVKEALFAQRLGRLRALSAKLVCGRPIRYYQESNWRGLRLREGGSALMNQAYHLVDTLLWLGGRVKKVEAFANRYTLHDVIETEDTISACLAYDSGALGSLCVTTAYSQVDWDSRIEIVGEHGRIECDLNFPNHIHNWEVAGMDLPYSATAAASIPAPGVAYYGSSHIGQIQDFVSAVVDGRPLSVNPEQALYTLDTILRIYTAARRNGFQWGDIAK